MKTKRCKDCKKDLLLIHFYEDGHGHPSPRCKKCHSAFNAAYQRRLRANTPHVCKKCGLDSTVVDFYRRSTGQIKQPCGPCSRERAAEIHERNRNRKARLVKPDTDQARAINADQRLAAQFLRLPRPPIRIGELP